MPDEPEQTSPRPCQAPAAQGNSFGANTVTCTATDDSGNARSAALTVNVLEPLRVVFLPPLADDNVADDVEGDADASNLFRPGQTIPHKVRILDCRGSDVTATVPVALKLAVSQSAGGGGTGVINDLDDFTGIGDADGSMVLVGDHYQFNLKTNTVEYPPGGARFQSLVTVSYRSAPGLLAGAEDARLVSR